MTAFLALPPADRADALAVAAAGSGRPIHLLEKDVYVVWALQALFGATPFARHLVFKGGTSLSKAYSIIRRFSEDVDITYDIREIAPDLIAKAGGEPIPPTRSQGQVWKKEIEPRLFGWIEKEVTPCIAAAAATAIPSARVTPRADKVFIEYDPLKAGTGYVAPVVRLDFGARATGEPAEVRPVVCDAAHYVPALTFPVAEPRVMRPERTFWEKATAMHVFCAQGDYRGNTRFARHWYDVVMLAKAGYADKAIDDRALANEVARHKGMFFRENDASGKPIDYTSAVSGALQLVPDGKASAVLADDYQRMIDDGLLLDTPEPFEALMKFCADIQHKANAKAKS